jgi:hypothetical protein
MKRFTDLIENYNDVGLKALSRIVEEPTEDQFNNEVDVAIKKSEGKIRNKRIAKPEVLAVEIEKEEVEQEGEVIEEDGLPVKPKFKSVKETDKGPGIQACAEEIEEDTIDEDITNTRISSIRRRKLIQKAAGERDNRDKGKLNNIVSGLRNSSSGIKEEVEDLFEKTLTPAQKEKAEEVVKSMKEKTDEFKKKYGDRWKNVMYATASAIAKKKA